MPIRPGVVVLRGQLIGIYGSPRLVVSGYVQTTSMSVWGQGPAAVGRTNRPCQATQAEGQRRVSWRAKGYRPRCCVGPPSAETSPGCCWFLYVSFIRGLTKSKNRRPCHRREPSRTPIFEFLFSLNRRPNSFVWATSRTENASRAHRTPPHLAARRRRSPGGQRSRPLRPDATGAPVVPKDAEGLWGSILHPLRDCMLRTESGVCNPHLLGSTEEEEEEEETKTLNDAQFWMNSSLD